MTELVREFVPIDDATFALRATQDVETIIDANKAADNHGGGCYSPDRSLKHVARIPMVIVEMWNNLYGVDCFNSDHADRVRALLNDPEWKYLRTGGGHLGRGPRE